MEGLQNHKEKHRAIQVEIPCLDLLVSILVIPTHREVERNTTMRYPKEGGIPREFYKGNLGELDNLLSME